MSEDKKDKDKVPSTLRDQAWKRAVENKRPNVATPYEWEEYERKKDTKE